MLFRKNGFSKFFNDLSYRPEPHFFCLIIPKPPDRIMSCAYESKMSAGLENSLLPTLVHDQHEANSAGPGLELCWFFISSHRSCKKKCWSETLDQWNFRPLVGWISASNGRTGPSWIEDSGTGNHILLPPVWAYSVLWIKCIFPFQIFSPLFSYQILLSDLLKNMFF